MEAPMPETLALSTEAFDKLMPMHLIVDRDGQIRHAGPTMLKIRTVETLLNRPFLDVFEPDGPYGAAMFDGRPSPWEGRMRLTFREPPSTALKGEAILLDGGASVIVALSFGSSVIEAVQEYGLTVGDFAATDLAVELLYLAEAKSVLSEELLKLSQRHRDGRIAADDQALTDTLTGLRNRRALDHVLARLTLEQKSFGLMHLDLDQFKSVNDRFGHSAGDLVLQQAANILRRETRDSDTVVRLGGDEFVLVFEGLVDPDRLTRIARRIIARLEEPITCEGRICQISAGIGAVLSTQYARPDPATMLRDAEQALYRSKRSGRGRTNFAQVLL
jgi:diguanylate cyclase (GGDEF)-like protein